jgi:hypothetical protein
MHTPTPWKAFDTTPGGGSAGYAFIRGEGIIGEFIADVQKREDAAFIVRAVNAHDELLMVLAVCARSDCQREEFEKKRCPGIFQRERWCATCLARDAVAKVKDR